MATTGYGTLAAALSKKKIGPMGFAGGSQTGVNMQAHQQGPSNINQQANPPATPGAATAPTPGTAATSTPATPSTGALSSFHPTAAPGTMGSPIAGPGYDPGIGVGGSYTGPNGQQYVTSQGGTIGGLPPASFFGAAAQYGGPVGVTRESSTSLPYVQLGSGSSQSILHPVPGVVYGPSGSAVGFVDMNGNITL